MPSWRRFALRRRSSRTLAAVTALAGALGALLPIVLVVMLVRELEAKIVAPYEDYPALLDSGDIDAVYVSTPVFRHREFAEPALRKGIHALVEKPLETSEEDCQAMIDAAQERYGLKGQLPLTSEQLIQANGAGMIALGAAMGLGIKSRLAAIGLLPLLAATTVSAHNFWDIKDDPQARNQQMTAFFGNLAAAGGLVTVIMTKN